MYTFGYVTALTNDNRIIDMRSVLQEFCSTSELFDWQIQNVNSNY